MKKINRKLMDTIQYWKWYTIDLRLQDAENYIDSVYKSKLDRFIQEALKVLFVAWLAFFVLVAMLMFSWKTSAYDNNDFTNLFPEHKQVIGCYNDRTWVARHKEYNDSCDRWWDHNITIPPRNHISIWLKYYTPRQIINRLAIVNFESNFNENSENPYAKWYVQTLKKWNIAPDIESQLSWMKNRNKTYSKVWYYWRYWKVRWCGYYWNNYNYVDWFRAWEEWVISCLYRYHYQANTWSWYARRGMEARKIYFEYFNIK